MLHKVQTLEEARRYRYGCWGGNPEGLPFHEGRCAASILPPGRGPIARQCGGKPGHGPAGLYCKKHDPSEIQRRAAERRRKYEEDCEHSRQARIAAGLGAATIEQLKAELQRRKDQKKIRNP